MKGFTLIELLAVIVIIAVIALITVPLITSGVEDARVASVVSTSRMVAKGLETYIFDNEHLLPTTVGQSIEVPLQTLIDGNYLKSVKSPYSNDSCTGYILVTKTETGYTNNPHINCLEPVNTSAEDGLNIHYLFDDFSEPTHNYVATPTTNALSWQGTVGLESTMTFRNMPVFYAQASLTGGGIRFSCSNGILELQPGEKAVASVWIYRGDTVNANPNFYMQAYTFDGTLWTHRDPGHGYMQIQHAFYKEDGTVTTGYETDKWVKQVTTITNTHSNLIRLNSNWYYLSHSFTTGKMNYSMPQLEKKGFETPFVNGTRTGTVNDFSANAHTANLDILTTPRWVADETKGGVYNFAKGTDVIPVTGALNGVYTNQKYSWGAWIKLDSTFNAAGRILMSQTNALELSIGSSRRVNATTRDTTSFKNTPSSEPLDLNKWYHVFSTSDGVTTKLYLNGKYVSEVLTAGFVNPSNNIYIGNWSSNQVFKGMIDDVRVYNRTLSEKEIKIMYELSK